MFDITALGETLIDFTPCGFNANGYPIFAQNPGGAPANVLAQAARLGAKTAFVGMVGQDRFGDFLRETMVINGINTDGLVTTEQVHTTLAFVQLDKQGERSFSFYRNPGADIMLRPENVDFARICTSHIFHFGSLSLTDEPIQSTTRQVVSAAREAGCIISYDPNYRPPLWRSEVEAKILMSSMLSQVDILKLSDEEMTILTGGEDPEQATKQLTSLGITLVLISFGAQGACYRCGDKYGYLPAYQVNTVDTNGAGDSFLGSILYRLRKKTLSDIRSMTEVELREIVAYGNAAGSLTTSANGSIPAMPDGLQIEHCLQCSKTEKSSDLGHLG